MGDEVGWEMEMVGRWRWVGDGDGGRWRWVGHGDGCEMEMVGPLPFSSYLSFLPPVPTSVPFTLELAVKVSVLASLNPPE